MANANVNEEILRITIDSTSKEEDKAICERYELIRFLINKVFINSYFTIQIRISFKTFCWLSG
jgi:hypothetical protein